jgi:uncharacterized protein
MNRLGAETSPYLLQHAKNPVHWWAWGEEALAEARRTNRPILLSVGYAACHWCHVMAHESFESPEVAAVMNELFVNIKVDREERPDLDKIYQLAQQMLTQRSGGWPLTMFLAPGTQRPFFGGTYFPKEPRYGMPAFTDLLRRVSEFHRTHREDIAKQSEALQQAFAEMSPPAAGPDAALTLAPLDAARERLAGEFDAQFGGFGSAPKFPHPTNIEFLLRQWRATAAGETPDLHSLYMATLTLKRMAEGGLYDHLGGGFARYSVDQYWMIPHFEKMLYDNGPLLALYAQTASATGDGFFADIAGGIANWVLREMQSPEGGYYSSLDADSEGHEGRFYVWDKQQIQSLLDRNEYRIVERRFGLDEAPNFEGHWHLHARESLEKVASREKREPTEIETILQGAMKKLRRARDERVRPGRDEKILTSWNGLMIQGMAVAARVLKRADLENSATRALDFIRSELWSDGSLLATFKDGRAHLRAYLDDYVFLADAIVELLQYRWRSADLQFATELLDGVLEHFADAERGAFFFTADDHEALMHRSKTFNDESLPNGNAVAARVFGRLGHLLGDSRYLQAAERTLRSGWAAMERHPQGHAALLNALEEHLQPVEIVIIRGAESSVRHWRDELAAVYAPRRLVFPIPDDAADLPAAIADKRATGDNVAYICRGMTCSPPINSLPELLLQLGKAA